MAIDIMGCYSTLPKPREYVLPGLLPGIVGSLVSPGGAGKSFLALTLAHCVAGRLDLLGLGSFHQGRVVYLSAEDGGDILHERLHAIGGKLSQEQREACAENLVIEDLTKHTPDLLAPPQQGGDSWLAAVERLATGSRLLFLDTLRSFHGGDENDGNQMAILVGHIRAMAARTGCAIVFLHHASKAAAMAGQGDVQQASRGSSVLTDNIRWQTYLVGMTPDEAKTYGVEESQRSYFVRFGISKQNYGSPLAERWFRKGPDGVPEPATLQKASKGKRGDHEL